MKIVFEYDGKKYTAEPAPYVRAAGVQLKVIKTDEVGNAEVKLDSKKGVQCSEATEVVADGAPLETAANDAQSPQATVQALKAQWEENAKAAAKAAAEKSELEKGIAAALLAIPRKKNDPHVPVKLGETLYRAQRGRDGNPPSLVVVPSVAAAL